MAGDAYASHLPVLAALEPAPKRVLEFGGGLHSTKAFLEMDSVTKLVTVETDPHWREVLEKEYSDKRWQLLDGSKVPALGNFDLVFIDDGIGPQQRMTTIARVLGQRHPKVVIHDAEFAPYQETIAAFAPDFELHAALNPATAIVPASPRQKKK